MIAPFYTSLSDDNRNSIYILTLLYQLKFNECLLLLMKSGRIKWNKRFNGDEQY